MDIEVRYFAAAREAVGAPRERVTVDRDATVADVVRDLVDRHPPLGAALPALRFALGETFVAADAPLHDGSVLALIPPVGGG